MHLELSQYSVNRWLRNWYLTRFCGTIVVAPLWFPRALWFVRTGWPVQPVCKRNLQNLKDKLYTSPSNFFKMSRAIFGVIVCQDFASPSLQMKRCSYLQTFRSDRPVMTNEKRTALVSNGWFWISFMESDLKLAKPLLRTKRFVSSATEKHNH